MADRFPLILNTSANQIQEIASGDSLDLTGSNITNAGIITANNVTIGAATTDLIVNGDARITGILTIGTSSLKLDGPNNLVNVGTALTLGHTQGLQFHTQNLHSAGFDVNQINVSGASTIGGNLDANGDLDVDGHTNLDNVSISGVTTISGAAPNLLFTETDANPDWGILCSAGQMKFQDVTATANILTLDSDKIQAVKNLDALAGIDVTGNLIASGNLTANNGTVTVSGTAPKIIFTETNANPDYKLEANGGNIAFVDTTNSATRLSIGAGGINVTGDGTFSGNVSIGGTLTYEDVTNIDSVGVVTARNGLKVTGGTSHFVGVANFNETIVGTARTALKLTCTDESTDTTTYPLFVAATTGDQFPKTGTNLSFNSASGALTATSFVGDGSNLTGITQTTINNNADNRLITGSGTANTLNGESELTYSTYLNLTRSNSDSNFGDNSAPGGVNGMFIGNSQSTNGVYSAITLSANDTNGTNQNASLISKSVNGGFTPEFHVTQRTASNTTETNFKITSARSVELNHQGNKRLHTNSNGIVVQGGAHFTTQTSITGTPKLYLYGYAGADSKGITIEGNESGLELVSSASGDHASSILLRNLNDGFAIINNNDQNRLEIRHFTAVSDNFNAHGNGNGVSTLKTCATFTENGAVSLYHNNSSKLETASTGTAVTGHLSSSISASVGTTALQAGNVFTVKGSTNNQINIARSANSGWGLLLTNSQPSSGYHVTTNSSTNQPCAVVNVNADALHFGTSNSLRWTIDHSGNLYPAATHNIGSSSSRANYIYGAGINMVGTTSPNTMTHTGGYGLQIVRGSKNINFNANYGGTDTHCAIDTNQAAMSVYIGGARKYNFQAGDIHAQTDNLDLGQTGKPFQNIIGKHFHARQDRPKLTLACTASSTLQPKGLINFESVNNDNEEDMYRINFYEGSAGSDTANPNASIRYNGSTSDGGDGSIRFANENGSRILYMNRLGNGGTSGSWSVGSDQRKKENITTVSDAITKVKQLRGVDFNWLAKYGGHQDSGVIAQEVEAVLPHLVITQDGAKDENGVIMKSVNYNGLFGVLIEAVKQLSAEVDALKGS